jgi:hypothetical protein
MPGYRVTMLNALATVRRPGDLKGLVEVGHAYVIPGKSIA